MRTVKLADKDVPTIGQGTWYMGEDLASAAAKWRRCSKVSSWA